MATKERLSVIKQRILAEKRVTVSRLSEEFGVTEETIRRDLEKLETQGLLTRTYGGAVLNTESAYECVSFYKRAALDVEAKQKIARKAAELLQNKTTVAADSSSTVMETLRLLKDRRDMTLLTNSVEALRELSTGEISVVSTGGMLNRSSLSLQGAIAKNTLRNYNVDILLMSCKGLSMPRILSVIPWASSSVRMRMKMVSSPARVPTMPSKPMVSRAAQAALAMPVWHLTTTVFMA